MDVTGLGHPRSSIACIGDQQIRLGCGREFDAVSQHMITRALDSFPIDAPQPWGAVGKATLRACIPDIDVYAAERQLM